MASEAGAKVYVVVTYECGGADGGIESGCTSCDVLGVYLSRESAEKRAKEYDWWGKNCENPLIEECEVKP